MKERPILFSAPMVKALLEGRKTQTRRVVKWKGADGLNLDFSGLQASDIGPYWALQSRGMLSCWTERAHAYCPYGYPSDRLWVKEDFTFINADRERDLICIAYNADGESLPTRVDRIVTPEQFADFMGDERVKIDPFKRRRYPSMFMNRWASRITLEVTEVRVQRLQEISEEDCLAEGIESMGGGYRSCEIIHTGRYKGEPHPHSVVPNRTAKISYKELWESINGLGSWATNPWAWAITFKVAAA
jgi:hypothetical protein